MKYKSSHYFSVENSHAHSCIVYVRKGSVEFHTLSECLSVGEGAAVFIPEDIRYYSVWSGNPDIHFISLQFRLERVSNAYEHGYRLQNILSLSRPSTEEVMTELHRLLTEGGPVNRMKAMGVFFSYFASTLPLLQKEKHQRCTPAVRDALQYIKDHAETDFSITHLAAHCCISESRLYHLFQEELHTTPVKYRNQLRTERAAQLLRKSDDSISDIAARCGFHSDIYFRKIFKSNTGCTPMEYRAVARTTENEE